MFNQIVLAAIGVKFSNFHGEMTEHPMPDALALFDLAGLVVFAATGALVASRKEMDIVGFALLATVTGVGGGTIRDLLLGVPVFWVVDPTSIIVCTGVAVIVFFTAHIPESRYRLLLWLDAIGLAAVAIKGCERAMAAGSHGITAILMGVITASFGGVIRDVMGGESPLILRREIYVSAAFLAATLDVLALGVGLPPHVATLLGFLGGFGVRALAIRFNWSLPVYRRRPGRTPEQLGL